MSTKNKSIEVGASHEGSWLRKTTLAKPTKSKFSMATSSSKKQKPAKRISSPMGTGVFGVRVFIPRDPNRCSPLLHVDLEEHISFKLTLKQKKKCGNNDKCATWGKSSSMCGYWRAWEVWACAKAKRDLHHQLVHFRVNWNQ
ncbi:hypothetical protein L3X38_033695 [Prunus dulcis]|uniref:Uncharacterized protein n=1 Tax=Prunus dulcis TaxID=3755 RepID=A0AAD4YW62_PRUDU|nr:hypothetical protein L3X38_033695 [Prunus dulcis]